MHILRVYHVQYTVCFLHMAMKGYRVHVYITHCVDNRCIYGLCEAVLNL